MGIANKMRIIGESTFFMNNVKEELDTLLTDIDYTCEYLSGEKTIRICIDPANNTQVDDIKNLISQKLSDSIKVEMCWRNSVPMSYNVINFLEGTKTQAIATGLLGNRLSLRVVSCHFEGRGGSGWGVACCDDGSVTGIFANTLKSVGINLRKKDETKTTWTMFSLPNVGDIFTSTIDFTNLTCTFEGGGKTPYVWAIPERYATYNGFGYIALFGFGTQSPTYIPTWARMPGRIYEFSAHYDGTPAANYIPALDPAGTPCMYDIVSHKPFYNNGTGQFIAGMTMAQALNLANLPATGGSLTVSLPSEASSDANVQSVLNAATDKGWTITVQYRESEVAAASLDDEIDSQHSYTDMIWVKKTEEECGNYIAADGKRYILEWCHQLFSQQTEQSLGYEQFENIDNALIHWNLTEYVDPQLETMNIENSEE